MPASKTNFTWIEIKAGLFVLISLGVFLGLLAAVVDWPGANALGDDYFAFFDDTGGLDVGADVRYGGHKVGRITAITLSTSDPVPYAVGPLRVEFTVQAGLPVHSDSYTFVYQTSLMSEKHLEVFPGTSTAGEQDPELPLPVKVKDLFGMIKAVGENMNGIADNIRELTDPEAPADGVAPAYSIPALIASVRETADAINTQIRGEGDGIGGIVLKARETLEHIDQAVVSVNAQIEKGAPKVSAALDNAASALSEAKAAATNAKDILGTVRDEVTPEIVAASKDLKILRERLDSVLKRIDDLGGQAEGFVSESRPAVQDLITELRDAIMDLQKLVETLNEQPQSIIRGRQPVGRMER